MVFKMRYCSKNIFPCLKAFCALKGDSVGSLAKILGNSKGTMASRLHGKSEFTLREADILSSYFEVPIEILFSRDIQNAKRTIVEFVSAKR